MVTDRITPLVRIMFTKNVHTILLYYYIIGGYPRCEYILQDNRWYYSTIVYTAYFISIQ